METVHARNSQNKSHAKFKAFTVISLAIWVLKVSISSFFFTLPTKYLGAAFCYISQMWACSLILDSPTLHIAAVEVANVNRTCEEWSQVVDFNEHNFFKLYFIFVQVWPVNHFPDPRINSASKTLVDKHRTNFPSERIIRQVRLYKPFCTTYIVELVLVVD